MQQLSKKGWRLKEPVDIAKEKPRRISQMAEILYGYPLNYRNLASRMNLPSQLMQNIIEAHTINNQNKIIKNAGTVLNIKKINDDIEEN